MANQQVKALADETHGAVLARQESLLQVVKLLERAEHLVDRALDDDAGSIISPEDRNRLASVRAKIQHAASLVTKRLA